MVSTFKGTHYDHPNYTIRRIISLGRGAATASVVHAAFEHPCNLKLYRIGAIANVAGTTATNTYTVRTDTTSVGLLTLADSAALFGASADLSGITLTAGVTLNLLKGTDATGIASFWLEYGVEVGAALPV